MDSTRSSDDPLAGRPSKSMSKAREQERAAIAAMSPRERVLLALRLGARRALLTAKGPADGSR